MQSELSKEIQRRIDNNEDVMVRGGVVSGEPCRFNHGYGKTAPMAESVDAPVSKTDA